jgi:hypothetical protein
MNLSTGPLVLDINDNPQLDGYAFFAGTVLCTIIAFGQFELTLGGAHSEFGDREFGRVCTRDRVGAQ